MRYENKLVDFVMFCLGDFKIGRYAKPFRITIPKVSIKVELVKYEIKKEN